MNTSLTRRLRMLGFLAPICLCVACGSSAGTNQAATTGSPVPTAVEDQFAQSRTADSYPVCGVGLGTPQALSGAPGLENDSYRGAPSPAPILDSVSGNIILRLVPDCEKGDSIQFSPASAARIIRQAPAADGLLAGARIEAHVRHFHILGTGAVPFDQRVDLDCPPEPDKCPTNPMEQSQIAHPSTIDPTPFK